MKNKRTKLNIIANRELKKIFEQKGIFNCELNLEGCNNYPLSFAHKHKRRWYYDKPDSQLWDFNEVVLSCINCHEKIEKSSILTREIFEKLRGKND